VVQNDLFTSIFNLGRQRKEQGMADANANSAEWGDDVRAGADWWLKNRLVAWDKFTTEDIRAFLTDVQKLPEPHHPNAWSAVLGGVCRQWRKNNVVSHAGWTAAKAPQANARVIRQYIKL